MALIEVLVALLLLTVVATAFLAAMAGFRQGSVRSDLLQGAVTCASYVVERVRGGLTPIPDQPVDGNCDAVGWPNLSYRLVAMPGDGGEGAATPNSTWRAISVTVFPSSEHGIASAAIYELTTAASVTLH